MGKCNEPANTSEKKDIQQTSSSQKGWVQKELSWWHQKTYIPLSFNSLSPMLNVFISQNIFQQHITWFKSSANKINIEEIYIF